jgi:hypothetical protein
VWWSRRSFRKAGERQVKREKKVEEERLGKAEIKGFRASNIFFNKKLAEKRCVEREGEREGKEGFGTLPKTTTDREGK